MRSYYEIFDEFGKQKTKEERIHFLKAHDSTTFRRVMRAAFHPNIKFFLTKVPAAYKPSTSIVPGMADCTMEQVMNKIYLFEVGNPRSINLTYAKREQLLIQFLEGMEPREAKILLDVLFKSIDVRYLTYTLVREIWPSEFPQPDAEIPKK